MPLLRPFLCVILLGGLGFPARGQGSAPGNLVPNPGFEDFAHEPPEWYYNGKDFSRTVRHWSSPTGASPDAYGPGVTVPRSWKEKGFGAERPRSGQAMAGITVYGCDTGKPHCREYLQVRLTEPLVYGQLYEVTFWAQKLARGGATDNLSIAFDYDSHYVPTPDQLSHTPAWTCRRTAGAWVDRWQRIGDTIRADGEYRYLLIGNFHPDSLTTFVPARKETLPIAYYYIDDVQVIKRPPYLVAPVIPEDLEQVLPEAGMVVRLQSIHFDTDQSVLLPASLVEVNKLHRLMTRFPGMTIEVLGHTDNQGGVAYNQSLSERRAQAVVQYLADRGVEPSRIRATGRGEHNPVARNDTAEGRQRNRRVEFFILSN